MCTAKELIKLGHLFRDISLLTSVSEHDCRTCETVKRIAEAFLEGLKLGDEND